MIYQSDRLFFSSRLTDWSVDWYGLATDSPVGWQFKRARLVDGSVGSANVVGLGTVGCLVHTNSASNRAVGCE